MNVVVFGANGPTGRLLTKQALAKGHAVTAVTRHPETFPIEHACLQVMQGDVHDLPAVEQAIAGQDAVLSSLGVPFTRKPVTVYSEGMANIMQAMQHHGVRRLVAVTSSATEPSMEPKGGFIFEKILQPFVVNVLGRTSYEDMRRMETMMRNSRLDWTIVRPSGLFETPEVTPYQMAETEIKGKFTSRTDLADCMLQLLTNNRYVGKVVAVATVAVQPNLLKLIWKEGIAKKS